MAELCVRIAEFTDPACPWAYSAEPFRHRLDWLYEGALAWDPTQEYVGADGFWRLNGGTG